MIKLYEGKGSWVVVTGESASPGEVIKVRGKRKGHCRYVLDSFGEPLFWVGDRLMVVKECGFVLNPARKGPKALMIRKYIVHEA